MLNAHDPICTRRRKTRSENRSEIGSRALNFDELYKNQSGVIEQWDRN